MARTPRDLSRQTILTMCGLCLALCGSGCEIGRTMFQYSSGSSSPFLGIDLIPRKKSPTTISYQEEQKTADKATIQTLTTKTKEPASRFQKKPIRLSLPKFDQEPEAKVLEREKHNDFSAGELESIHF